MGPMTHGIAYFKGHQMRKILLLFKLLLFRNCNKNEKKTFMRKWPSKGQKGRKKGVVYLSVDSSMKENNGQQLKVSGFESSWIYQRTFAESDAEGHHSWVSRLEQQCTHLSFHWCENITHVELFCICTRGLKVIQFQILFSLLRRKKKRDLPKDLSWRLQGY